jgi:hypothetical protein
MRISQIREYDQTTTAREYPAQQAIYVTGQGTAVVVIAMLLFSLGGMIFVYLNNESATTALITFMLFFAFATPLGVMANNGSIAHIISTLSEHATIREQNRQVYTLQRESAPLLSAEPPPTYTLPADPLQTPSAPPSYIAAVPRVDPLLKVAAAGWVSQLFDERGAPNSKIKGAKSNIQVSKPEEEVREYLLSLGIIREDEGRNLYFDLDLFPVLRYALNTINTGVRRTHPPMGEYGGGERGINGE